MPLLEVGDMERGESSEEVSLPISLVVRRGLGGSMLYVLSISLDIDVSTTILIGKEGGGKSYEGSQRWSKRQIEPHVPTARQKGQCSLPR